MSNPNTKRKAIKTFISKLLATPIRDEISKIFLFGSVLRGDFRRDSDIDLLIIATGSLDKVRDACADAALETWILCRESIEPLVYCIDELRFPSSYFIYHVITRGEEVYRMDEFLQRIKEVQGYLSLSEAYLQSAQRNFSWGDYRIAVDIAYNSCELCAKAAILLKVDEIPGSHGGVVNRFGELYVRTGEVKKEIGRGLNRGLELRNKATYDSHAEITEKQAQNIIQLAEEMIKIVESVIPKLQ